MTDRELLEAAAKAAGVEYDPKASKPHPKSGAWWGLWLVHHDEPSEYARRYWNPLTDDGDALRLAVKLGMSVWCDPAAVCMAEVLKHCLPRCSEPSKPDPLAATRRAIVRAAAALTSQEPRNG